MNKRMVLLFGNVIVAGILAGWATVAIGWPGVAVVIAAAFFVGRMIRGGERD